MEPVSNIEVALLEAPHLFANGNFSLKKSDLISGTIYAWDERYRVFHVRVEGTKFIYNAHIYQSDGILMARPQSDMTEEEQQKYFGYNLDSNFDRGATGRLLYQLSIGVYPFDQNHFKDGTVIDINKT